MDITHDIPLLFVDFGVSATLSGVAVIGLFEDTAAQALGLIGGREISFWVDGKVITDDPRGKTLVIGKDTYTVVDWTLSDGLASLKLETV